MTRSLLHCTLLLLVLFGAGPLSAAEAPASYIAVTGEAQARLAPDMAVVELTVNREADTARAALDANSAAMADVIKAMRAAGIAERDLQTSNFSIQPKYQYEQPRSEGPPRIAGYSVRNSLTVTVRDLDELGGIIDTSVRLGVNEGGNVTFSNADPSAALEQARAAAVKDAMGKAATIAGAAGVKTGDILSITEDDNRPMPRPVMMEAKMSAAAAVPMASGENSYTVSVKLRVAIAQ